MTAHQHAPAVPDFAYSVAAVFRLQMRRVVRGRKLRLGIVATALVLLTTIVTRYASPEATPEGVVRAGLEWGFFTLLVFLLPFLFTAGAIAEEVESRTFGFLAARPVGRAAITVGKYLAGVALALAVLLGGLLVMHFACYATTPTPMIDELDATLRAAGAITLLTLFYGGLCLFWGAAAPEAAGIISALHLATLELGFGLLPFVFRFVSMNYHARQLAGLPKGGLMERTVPDVPVAASVGALVGVALLTLGFAMLVVRTSEYRFGKA